MSYRVVHLSSFQKDVKGFKKQPSIVSEAKEKILEIIENPATGGFLLKSWEGFQKVSFHNKPEIRLIYRVYPCCMLKDIEHKNESCIYEDEVLEDCSGLIDFVFMKTREECNNLYALSKKYSNNFRRD